MWHHAFRSEFEVVESMAPRSFWKGYLRLSLVTCRVAMAPATTASEKVTFRTINRKTGHPIESRYVDEATRKPVRDQDLRKGYPLAEDNFVLLEDEEFDAVALESTRTIDIDMFVPRDDISGSGWTPLTIDADDKIAEEAFSVIRDAMAARRWWNCATRAYRRERACWSRAARGSRWTLR